MGDCELQQHPKPSNLFALQHIVVQRHFVVRRLQLLPEVVGSIVPLEVLVHRVLAGSVMEVVRPVHQASASDVMVMILLHSKWRMPLSRVAVEQEYHPHVLYLASAKSVLAMVFTWLECAVLSGVHFV